MNLFRLQNNVPPTYVEQSRDFQLFCRLYDTIFNGVRFDIESIPNIIDPMKISDNLLSLYATKVGFYTNNDIDNNVLRYILSAFPIAIRNKGTKLGIEQAVAAILKAENSTDRVEINIWRYNDSDFDYSIDILTPIEIYNKTALKEFLKYIIPAGFKYRIQPYNKESLLPDPDTLAGVEIEVNTRTIDNTNSAMISDGAEAANRLEEQGAYNLGIIAKRLPDEQ